MAFEKVEYSFPDEQEDIKKPEIESSSAIEIDLDKGKDKEEEAKADPNTCLLYTSPSPRDGLLSRMPSSA